MITVRATHTFLSGLKDTDPFEFNGLTTTIRRARVLLRKCDPAAEVIGWEQGVNEPAGTIGLLHVRDPRGKERWVNEAGQPYFPVW